MNSLTIGIGIGLPFSGTWGTAGPAPEYDNALLWGGTDVLLWSGTDALLYQ